MTDALSRLVRLDECGTGRTYRMLMKARELALQGKRILVLGINHEHANQLFWHFTRICSDEHIETFNVPINAVCWDTAGTVWFRGQSRASDWILGNRLDAVLYDHACSGRP